MVFKKRLVVLAVCVVSTLYCLYFNEDGTTCPAQFCMGQLTHS